MNCKALIWITSIIFLCISLSACITLSNDDIIYVDRDGGSDFSSIQSAIDAAKENSTISVANGIYVENIYINKSITLIGASAEQTIIDGNKTGDVVHITKEANVALSGFTIKQSGSDYTHPEYDAGIDIRSSHSDINNNIISENAHGIFSTYSIKNNFTNNFIHSNSEYGLYLYTVANNHIVMNNVFSNNTYAVRVKGSERNIIVNNLFEGNMRGIYFCCGATKNYVYHNDFVNNSFWHGNDYVGGNTWDNGYPSGGNYWDDYTGIDVNSGPNQNMTGSDGIGDTPYEITTDKSKIDRYPLMEPVTKQP